MQTATVTTQGAVQSVQLPEGIHLEGGEVYVKRLGKSVLLIPKDADPWDMLVASLDHFSDDYMAERSQPVLQHREGLAE